MKEVALTKMVSVLEHYRHHKVTECANIETSWSRALNRWASTKTDTAIPLQLSSRVFFLLVSRTNIPDQPSQTNIKMSQPTGGQQDVYVCRVRDRNLSPWNCPCRKLSLPNTRSTCDVQLGSWPTGLNQQ
ncbi:hypothetical protein RRG08_050591 [Elysia crispata]|uniref:Uncharacterized protein n=1 Tax=Elysia crispata TaxID=231223 RepID=A0AAE0Z789_9GAST|nr:hypothetical protein RRG08_050591 [Elysia crispata]